MSWLPAFKLGWLNAWTLMLVLVFHPLIMIVVDKAVGTGGIFKKMGAVPYTKGAKRTYVYYMVVLVILVVYSIFLPLKVGTAWLHAGLVITLVGLVMLLAAIVN